MSLFLVVVILIVLPAVLATIASAGLATLYPTFSRRRRVGLAALAAGLLPVTPGLIAVWRTYHATTLVPLGAVFALGLIVALLVGLPAALRATRTARK
ncbi:MAG: hypothetical protein RIS94_1510 [Pseudomonadota bacterium]